MPRKKERKKRKNKNFSGARSPDHCGWSRAYGVHVCVGPPRHYCNNRNPTPSFLSPAVPNSPPPPSLSLLLPVFFLRPLLLLLPLIPPHHRSHLLLLLLLLRLSARASLLVAVAAVVAAAMDLVSPSEHLCYVRCTYCNTVLAVNSSRNRSSGLASHAENDRYMLLLAAAAPWPSFFGYLLNWTREQRTKCWFCLVISCCCRLQRGLSLWFGPILWLA